MPPAEPLRRRGRFAPSPTGPLHFGSLVAALASCLDIRQQGGEWLVRMEDVDEGRNQPGAADDILRTLAAFGFEWDGPVSYQTTRKEAYGAALEHLRATGLAYGCACSRREIAALASRPAVDGGLCYPGTCRAGLPAGQAARAWRLRVPHGEVRFADRIQGEVTQSVAEAVGDFVLWRADGYFAYQLAVVVDDAWQGISDVVRGSDLLASTARQIVLQQCLGLPTPTYAHLPLALNAAGEKLSKQTLAAPLDPVRAPAQLCAALRFLGQPVPAALDTASVAECWAWASAHWSLADVPRAGAEV